MKAHVKPASRGAGGSGYALQILIAIISVSACYVYFDIIGPVRQYGGSYYWSRPANISDHFLYVDYAKYRSITELAIADNNFGISWLYASIVSPYRESEIFAVNISLMLIAFFFYCRICSYFGLGKSSYWAWLLNVFILYFSLLINKDMATIAVIMAVSWMALQRRFLSIALLLPIVFILRQQLSLFLALVIFLEVPLLNYKWKVIIVFITGSVAGIIALQTFEFMAVRSLGEGLTGQITGIFLDEAWLAPLGVPIRLLLYIYDYGSSIVPFYEGRVDALQVLRIPTILFFLATLPGLVRALRDPRRRTDPDHYRPLLSVTIAFLAALLINPQINARYLTCLVPLLVLLVMVIRHKIPYSEYLRRNQIKNAESSANARRREHQ